MARAEGRMARAGDDQKGRLVDEAYAALKAAVRDNEFSPGQQLSEQELALRFGMSRTPIHEALLKLQQEGLVRIVPKRGIQVCALAPEDLAEIYEVVIAIETSAAERLALAGPEDRAAIAAELDEATDAMAEALGAGDLQAWGRADERFHRRLVERCGNSRFAAILATVNDQSHRARMLTLHLRPALAISVADHRQIAAAIRDGNAATARDAARLHRTRARDELLPLIRRFGFRHL